MSKLAENFSALYKILMKNDFMKRATPGFGKKPTYAKVRDMVTAAAPLLPAVYQSTYVKPLEAHLKGLVSRAHRSNPRAVVFLEALTGAVYEHGIEIQAPPLRRFLAVISDLYLSFLDKTKREHLKIPLKEVLPPLAVLQSSPGSGPFTVPIDQVSSMLKATVGVVSFPATFRNHPLFYGSLAHETGGHDVIHADPHLMAQLRADVYKLFTGQDGAALGLLWDYWMDEAAADVYGLLNVGPTFGANLAALLAVFVAQIDKKVNNQRPPKSPRLRTKSDPGDKGALDDHPTDILRLSLAQGVISALTGLNPTAKKRYIAELEELTALVAPEAKTIKLAGTAKVDSGKSMKFKHSFPLSELRQSAHAVGAQIATAKFDSLAGGSIQDIETWDDADENTAGAIATAMRAGKSVVDAGDDAQIIAGLTLAVLDRPDQYAEFTSLANDALDASFRADEYWGTPGEPATMKQWAGRTTP
jgi:hypothetical protein